MISYGLTATLGGSGFLAVYVAGLVLADCRFVGELGIRRFHDALAWLEDITMFLVLGLLVYPSGLATVAGPALLVALVLALVARPVAVLTVLAPTNLPMWARLLIAWVGLRGAVPIVLATVPLVRGAPDAELIFDVVFFATLTSVLVHGITLPIVAKRLGVAMETPA